MFATPDIRVISEPAEGGVYGRGEKIEVRMGFSEAVEVSGDVWISLLLDDFSFQQLRYARGSGTDALVFAYTVQSYDRAADGVGVERGVGNRGFGGSGTIRSVNDPADAANYNRSREFEIKVDGSLYRPLRVTGIRVDSSPESGDAYGRGEDIEVAVTFSAEARVKDRENLSVALQIGAKRRLAHFVSGSETDTLVFAYTVQQSERDADGVVVVANSLSGGPICTMGIINGPRYLYTYAGPGGVESFYPSEPEHKFDGRNVRTGYKYDLDADGHIVPVKDDSDNYVVEDRDIIYMTVGEYKMDVDGNNVLVPFYVYKSIPLTDEEGNHLYEADPRSLVSTNCRDASDDGYWLDSMEAGLGHASFAAGPDHKVDGWQHKRPTDLSRVELPIPENLNFIGYSDRLELVWDAAEDVGDRVTPPCRAMPT